MAKGAMVGTVGDIWRFPVKSMGGERLDQAEVTGHGLVGDRAYALIDVATDKPVSAKRIGEFPGLLHLTAAFVASPAAGRVMPAVRIRLPDGSVVTSEGGGADPVLSAWFGRQVRLVEQAAPPAPAPEPDRALPIPAGSFFDAFPVSVLTTSTLRRLGELQPGSRFDARRFRMNLILDTAAPGFLENGWVGNTLRIGEGLQLGIEMPDPRCVMTTLAQGDLPEDADILRTLTKHNRLQCGDWGRLACAGVYATVGTPGTVRAGDRVVLGQPSGRTRA